MPVTPRRPASVLAFFPTAGTAVLEAFHQHFNYGSLTSILPITQLSSSSTNSSPVYPFHSPTSFICFPGMLLFAASLPSAQSLCHPVSLYMPLRDVLGFRMPPDFRRCIRPSRDQAMACLLSPFSRVSSPFALPSTSSGRLRPFPFCLHRASKVPVPPAYLPPTAMHRVSLHATSVAR